MFRNLPQLKTDQLFLRQLKMSDVEATFEYASDPEVLKYTFWYTHYSIADSRQLIEWLLSEDFACWSIVHKAENRVIGVCFLYNFDFHNRKAEIAFNLTRKYWGNGYMTEAVREMICFAFKRWRLNRIEGTCMPENLASARVMEKVGMQYEGLLRQYRYAKGRYYDLKMYGILREDI
jgi:[ribosomal protein S5]-alanine N-acetyltransferase